MANRNTNILVSTKAVKEHPKSKPIASLKNEQWKPLKTSDRKYFISNLGRLKGFYFDRINGQLVKGKTINGYLAVDIVHNKVRKTRYIHNLVAEHFVKGKSSKACLVIHTNWNKQDNKATNLQWYRPAAVYERNALKNKKHALKTGSVSAKLTIEQVSEIKKEIKSGRLQNKIASSYGISEMQISRIARGISWPHVK